MRTPTRSSTAWRTNGPRRSELSWLAATRRLCGAERVERIRATRSAPQSLRVAANQDNSLLLGPFVLQAVEDRVGVLIDAGGEIHPPLLSLRGPPHRYGRRRHHVRR